MLSLFTLPTQTPPTSGLGGYGLPQAINAADNVATLVEERISDAANTATALRTKAEQTIASIGDLAQPILESAPTLPTISFTYSSKGEIVTPELVSFGEISVALPTMESLQAVPIPTDTVIPDFVPSVQGFSLPQMPALPTLPDVGDAPVINDIDAPAAPSVTLPSMPNLLELNVPDLAIGTLPTFDLLPPTPAIQAVNAVLDWQEPTYKPVIFDEILANIRFMWGDGLGLPPTIENAMWERATERDSLQSSRDIQDTFNTFSARGFTRPPGTLAQAVERVRTDRAMRLASISKDMRVEVAKIHVENIRNAVQQAVAAENMMITLHNERASRMLQAAKAQVESAVAFYNAQVSLFNATVSTYTAQAEVFKTRLSATIDTYRAQLDAAVARGKVNEQRLAAYSATIQALNYVVSIYESQVKATTAKAALAGERVNAYRATVQAYAERANMARIPLEAYRIAVEAETAKTGLVDAEARVYSAMIGGKVAKAEVSTRIADIVSKTNEQKTMAFASKLDLIKASVEAQATSINARAEAFKASTAMFAAKVEAQTKETELDITAQKYAADTTLAYTEAQINLFKTRSDVAIAQIEQAISRTKAIGDVSSTLAAGAMAGVNVGASMSGTAQVVGSGSSSYSESLGFQQSISEGQSYSESTNYNGTLTS